MKPPLMLAKTVKLAQIQAWTSTDWKSYVTQPKLDGGRLVYVPGQGFTSRTGKPFAHLDRIADALDDFPYILDGEVMADDWSDTMSIIRAMKSARDAERLKFHVFDMLTPNEWESEKTDRTWDERSRSLLEELPRSPYLCTVPNTVIANFAYFKKVYESYLAMGCDGAVIKHRRGLYTFKRSVEWMKYKPIETIDAKVTALIPGLGKHEGRMGALRVLSEKGVVFKVGTGFSDEERERDKRFWVGKVIEVKIRGFHPSGAPVEPRFFRVRHDKC